MTLSDCKCSPWRLTRTLYPGSGISCRYLGHLRRRLPVKSSKNKNTLRVGMHIVCVVKCSNHDAAMRTHRRKIGLGQGLRLWRPFEKCTGGRHPNPHLQPPRPYSPDRLTSSIKHSRLALVRNNPDLDVLIVDKTKLNKSISGSEVNLCQKWVRVTHSQSEITIITRASKL